MKYTGIILTWIVLSSYEVNGAVFRNFLKNIPSWDSYVSAQYAGEYDKQDSYSYRKLSPENYRQLQMLFRFANLKDSHISEIMNTGGLPLDLGMYEHISQENILRMIENNINFRWKDLHGTRKNDPGVEEYIDFEDAAASRTDYWMNNTSDDEDYQECYKDYSTLAEPITNSVLKIVARRFLSELLLDINNQTVFCNITCNELCDIFGTNDLCPSTCNFRCNRQVFNKTALIEALLDFFIPDVEPQPWGRFMVDSLGKVPSGVRDAQLMWPAAFYMCTEWTESTYNYTDTASNSTEERYVIGKHCRLPFKPQAFLNTSLTLYVGICVPDICNKQHIHRYIYEDNIVLSTLLNDILKWEIPDADKIFCSYENDLGTDTAMLTCLAVLVILVAINLVATQYDAHFRPNTISKILKNKGNSTEEDKANASNGEAGDKNGQKKRAMLQHSTSTTSTQPLVVQSLSFDESPELNDKPTFWNRLEVAFVRFSAYTNMKLIFQIDRPKGYISTVDFMRFISFCWVMFGHTFLFGPLYNESWCTGNLISVLGYFPYEFAFQGILNFHLAGDTFFLISGILTAYHWMGRYDQGKETLTWRGLLFFYVNRYWKLTVTMMLVLMFYTCTYQYISTAGPLAPTEVNDARNCRTNWWTNLLLLHNLVNTDYLCMSWTWYVACVFQLHLIAPLILIPMIIYRRMGYGMLMLCYVAHICATAVVTSNIYDAEDVNMWFFDYLVTPWCRAGPYLIGMALGIFLNDKKLNVNIPKFVKPICGLLALVCLFVPAYGTYTRHPYDWNDWSKAEYVMWDTCNRSMWAIGVSWFILVCSTGNGGYLGDWMNHPMHQPLARLVYPAFLYHAIVVFGNVYSQHVVIYVNWTKMIHMGVSNLCVSLFLGLMLVSLVFHYPLAYGLSKACTVKTKRDCTCAGNHPFLATQNEEQIYRSESSENAAFEKTVGDEVKYPRRRKENMFDDFPSTLETGPPTVSTKF